MTSQSTTQNDHHTVPPQIPLASLQRITFVAPFGLGQKTTVWARILPLAQYLHRQGLEVEILIPPWDTPAHSGLIWSDGGVRIENVRLAGGPPAIFGRMVRRLQRRPAQIVHIVKPVAYAGGIQTLLWHLGKALGIHPRIVLDIDDWEQDWARLNGRSGPVQRLISWQENWGHTHAHGITAASQWLVDQVQRRNPALPICYLPNGLAQTPSTSPTRAAADDAPVHYPTPESAQILFFSRFMEISPAWLADFCTTIFDHHPTATLQVAGAGIHPQLETDFKTAFQSHAAQSELDISRIQWLGHIRLDDLGPLYESSVCAIFPAQPTPLQQAKCSVRLATTLLHGVPVIASAVGEQRAYGQAGNIQLLAPDATPQAFAQAVLELLQDPDTQRTRQRAAHASLLAQYNWSALGARLYEFYGTLLG
ncbi:MAG: glycosyltransferase family 4 protein [Litorilinea sp.]